ncbi:FAD-dependent oxidoreductase [Streptomyces sp. DSM 44915]|uniref:FAD-dependent oxidoreductase n=1 Tax=Streptomyces chisholmiae TaxID=3075540 RepID=A0ABU2JMA4_9ACTN|nr:FAD-dependent oxidoreductase [Streptomyces sp. DSM 44915]MDT0266047.1 FAD-dependent oxidoreductase [Streptomyces sp. DSM 44915]
MTEIETQLLIVGGGLGGVSAALAAARRGVRVVLSEPTDWLGGVLTTQGVPPDEHVWIERFGSTATYRAFRAAIRSYYRQHYPLTEAARGTADLNPGAAKVSGLSHEPRVSLAVIEALLAPHRAAGRIRVLLEHEPVSVQTKDPDTLGSVTLRQQGTGDLTTVRATWFVDATETGDLLPLAGVEYVTGAESRNATGEPHAPELADPLNMQPVSVCFALDHLAGEDLTIDRPESYDYFLTSTATDWPDGRLSLTAPHPKTLAPSHHAFFPNPGEDHTLVRPDYADQRVGRMDRNLWTFRRVAAAANFLPGAYPSDITLVNWPQMDYWDGPVFEVPAEQAEWHTRRARALSLSLLYWLQTAAPRPDGGTGWPGLRLRGDLLGDTPDGLAKAPYIRESRRIVAEHTIVEQEISLAVRGERGAVRHRDSVGVGMYRIDLHPSTGGDSYIDIGCCPFELPLGALIPVRVTNLLAGAKNIGTTHITNGAYRMPLVEWNIGEVDGHLVGFCAAHDVTPSQVRADDGLLAEFQEELDSVGVERSWPRITGY